MNSTSNTSNNVQNKKLPEGYTPLEYIEYRPKQVQQYVYGNFERFKDASQLAKKINDSCKNVVCGITISQTPDDVSFRVVFPESVFNQVDFINKQDCEIVKPPVMFTYNIPKVYRFVEEKYIDSFFETGKLKLTTFEKCKQLEDANRNDANEGVSVLNGYDGKYRFECKMGVGSDVIMLCTSLCNSYSDSNRIPFGQSIEIFDIQGLMIAIAEQLKEKDYNIKGMLYGPCFYSEKEFHGKIDSAAFREKQDVGVFDWDEMIKINQSISGPNIYFQKPIDKRTETEFRMIWLVDDIKGDEDVFVTIQDPRKYCRKVSAVA
ncbi:MAG: hypothetical protein J5644_04820 [Bacteroidales bacterium]|nr:hypothetical protein [Bacteroidales bacterium]